MQSKVFRAAAFAAAFALGVTASLLANAADMPRDYGRKYNPPPPPPVYSERPNYDWAGWYLGAVVGYGWNDVSLNAPAGTFSADGDGWLGGGLVGYNWQSGRFVFGVEADIVGTDIEGSTTVGINTASPSVDWMAGLRARAGIAVTPNMLLFASLGGAWAEMDLPVTGAGGGSGSETFSGLQVGGGAEVMLNRNWRARLEYLYTDFDTETVTYPGGPITYDPDMHQVRGALIYRF